MVHKSIFIWSLLLLLVLASDAKAMSPIVGYGSSDAILPAKNQELFYLGFEAGMTRRLKSPALSEYVTTSQISDGSYLGAIKSVKNLIMRNVKIIAGYPTSHEAVLVGRITRDLNVLTIFPSAGHSELAAMGDRVFTTGESTGVTVNSMIAIAKGIKQNVGKCLISFNPRAVFSMDQDEELEKAISQGRHQGLVFEKVYLSESLRLDDAIIKSLREGKYDCLIMTMYPDESVEIMKQLDENGLGVPIVTNSSWSTGDIEFLRRIIAHMKSPIYGFSLWVKESPQYQDAATYIERKYGRKPTTEIMDGYDLGIIVGTIIQRMQSHNEYDDPLAMFQEDTCFEGTSTGKICFPVGGGHAVRTVHKVMISKDGYIPVK